jgi:hypothetical protein
MAYTYFRNALFHILQKALTFVFFNRRQKRFVIMLIALQILFYFLNFCGVGLRLSPLGTSVTNWPVVPAQGGRRT